MMNTARKFSAQSAAILLIVCATPFMMAQVQRQQIASVDISSASDNGAQMQQIRSIEQRLDRIDALHVEALAEAVRQQGEAIKTQQTLLWGVLGAVLINIATGVQIRRK